MILFLVTIFLATGTVVIYNQIGQSTSEQSTPIITQNLKITHASIHGITNRQAQYLTLELMGEGELNITQAYVSVTTPQGTVQLPIIGQG